MAEMGSTGTINITVEQCNAAIAAIGEYEGKVKTIAGKMDTTVNTLVTSNFIGDAGSGYKTFYEGTIKPIISTEATCTVLQLTKVLNDMMEGLRKLMPDPDGTDDKLGDANVAAGKAE